MNKPNELHWYELEKLERAITHDALAGRLGEAVYEGPVNFGDVVVPCEQWNLWRTMEHLGRCLEQPAAEKQ